MNLVVEGESIKNVWRARSFDLALPSRETYPKCLRAEWMSYRRRCIGALSHASQYHYLDGDVRLILHFVMPLCPSLYIRAGPVGENQTAVIPFAACETAQTTCLDVIGCHKHN
jgi:hypothetical protein